jgi:hypothetical protein
MSIGHALVFIPTPVGLTSKSGSTPEIIAGSKVSFTPGCLWLDMLITQPSNLDPYL